MSFNTTLSLYFLDGEYAEAGLPPTPALWLSCLIDTMCTILPCKRWREVLVHDPESWYSEKYRVPSAFEPDLLPRKLTYDEFLHRTSQTDEKFTFSTLYQYAFETTDTSLSLLSTPSALMVTLFVVLLIRIFKRTFMPMFSDWGRRAALRRHGEEWVENNEERLYKFGEYCYRLCFHTAMSVYGVYYLWDKPWASWENKASSQIDLPNHPMSPGHTWYYLIQAAYNLDAFLSLLVISFEIKFRKSSSSSSSSSGGGEGGTSASTGGSSSSLFRFPLTVGWSPSVRGDFTEMAIHHLATNGLVFFSSLYRLTRAGSIVLCLHDISDVPIDISKLMNFLRYKTATIACFVIMVVVWVITRMYLFPYFVIYTAFVNAYHLMDTYPRLIFLSQRHIVYVLMLVLAFLHCFWFTLFLRMFYRMLFKKEISDLSEHKQGEKQDSGGRREEEVETKKAQ